MPSTRVCVLLMDSFGIGASHDAKKYGDEGADTFGHIWDACEAGSANVKSLRTGALKVPNLAKRGLYHASLASTGVRRGDLESMPSPKGYFGYAVEESLGKDTPSGHWEIAGVPVLFEWGYFKETIPCFPKELIENFEKQADLPGVLGLKHASGTDIIDELGQEHIRTGKPIIYTSADSVFQIAAHEKYFGLDRLYQISEIARRLVDEYQIGRVIARPFIGENGHYSRTANRRDYATPPPKPTLLDCLKKAQHEVIAIGKVADIYAHQGITQTIKATNNMDIFDKTLQAMKNAPDGSLVFSNFVDFDSSFGHRRNVAGYANALEEFDKRLPELDKLLKDGDMVIITADHGCDPTKSGTDHTREHIPLLAYGPGIESQFTGRRDTFADIGQGIAKHLGIEPLDYGTPFTD